MKKFSKSCAILEAWYIGKKKPKPKQKYLIILMEGIENWIVSSEKWLNNYKCSNQS